MAAILPGPGTPVSGSVGAVTYARNRYGAYTRSRTKPVNPTSPLQNRARSIFMAGIAAWSSLTFVQRSQWEDWAANTPWLNRAGEACFLTGQVAFNRHFCSQMQLTFPAAPAAGFLVPPLLNDVGTIAVSSADYLLEYTVASGAFTATLDVPDGVTNSWAAAGASMLVEMTPGQNQTRNFPGSRWSQVFAAGGNTSGMPWATDQVVVEGTTDDETGNHAFPYGLQVGQRVWMRCRGLSLVTDRRVTEQVIIGPFTVAASA